MIRSGARSCLEQVVWLVSSLYVALGRRATCTCIYHFSEFKLDRKKIRTVFQGGDHSEEGSIEDVSVIVDASRVDIEDPCGLSRADTEGGEGDDVRTILF